jgi:3-oxoadipate enol-lactonase
MPVLETGDWKINYIEEGKGPPVVLIHGLAGDHTAWMPQIQVLKEKYRVVAFDNPGSGQSSKVSKPTSMAAMAHAFLKMFDQLGISSAHVVGRSMGGAIAQEMTLASPKRVRSLVLAGSFAKLDALGERLIQNMRDFIVSNKNWSTWTRQFSFAFISPAFFNGDAERLARLERIIADESRDVKSYANLANACLAADTTGRLRSLTCPTLIMAGKLDPICSQTTTDMLLEELPQATTAYFDQSSHFFLMEEKNKANETLLSWFASQ